MIIYRDFQAVLGSYELITDRALIHRDDEAVFGS